MTEKLIYIPNDNTQITPSSVYYNYWLKRLDTQFNDPTNQNLVKIPKLLENFGDWCNKTAQCPLPP